MCNGVSRGWFLAAAGAAALPLTIIPAAAAELPAVPPGLSEGNARAAQVARTSHFIRTQYAGALQLARSIGDAHLHSDVLGLLANPVPTYARKYRTAAQRLALRDELAAAGFIKPDDPVVGIFPPGADGDAAVQPFWSAPGSAYDSHHSYPGGLLVHELFNARMADYFAKNYDAIYFAGRPQIDRDLVIAAAFYHDIMKTVVFQFNPDGSLLPELQIAGTGGHHCLSGAEAIVRGHDARFVTVLLSAHAAPSLGDEAKVAQWCRASAMIAGVDPADYVPPKLPPIEAFVSNLSDHDYVLSVHAMQKVSPVLETVAPAAGYPAPAGPSDVRWWRHRVLANASAIALYEDLVRGPAAFINAVRKASH